MDVEVHSVPLRLEGQVVASYALYEDISKRKQAEERLRDANTKLNAVIQASPLGIVTTDQDERIVFANPAFQRLFQFTAEEVKGAVLNDLIVPPELKEEGDGLTRRGRTGEVIHAATQRKRKDGSLLDVELYGVALQIEGKPTGGLVLYQDISRRRRAENALRESNETLSAIFEASPLAIVGLDLEGKVVMWNPAAERTFGWSASEVIGRQPPAVGEQEQERFEALHREALQGHGITELEVPAQKKDGSPIEVSLSRAALRDASGAVRGTVDILADITERKRAQESLRKLSQALEQTAESILVTDRNGVIEYANPGFTHLTGYTSKDVIGQTPRILKSGKHQIAFYKSFWGTILSGRVYRDVFVNKKKTGEIYYEEKTVAPVKDANGSVANFVAVGRDITIRKRAEEELQKAKEAAEEANRAKGDFLANMSHEIRTPMNGIIGMTDLTLETDLTVEQREYLEMVKSSADSLLRVINDILDFSRVEAGKLELQNEPFALRQSIGETMKVLGHLAHRKHLELAWHAAANVPEWVVGDCGRLRQMLVNLVGNAIKFTERGEVVVNISVEKLDEAIAELHFRIADTGIGIAPEKQALIFGAFMQADGSTTRKYGGTGLGLAIVQRLVSLQGGKLWVESAPGKGSTFHLTLSLGLPGKSFVVPQDPTPDILKGLRALVVDDNRTNRLIVTDLLKRWGISPQEAGSGSQALKLLQSSWRQGKPFRLVVLDAQMPQMDGFALAQRIRNDKKLTSTLTIMLSSGVGPAESVQVREVGLAAYLTKPVQPSELLDAILDAFTRTKHASPVSASVVSQDSASKPAPGLRILLAEDNAVNRQFATRLLEKRGHTVIAVNDGRQALEALEREDFNLVLMDVQMPEMDGLEATRMIRKKEKSTGVHIPVIAVTAHVMKGDCDRCLEAGADDYVSKPIQAEQLNAAIGRHCGAPKPSEESPSKPADASPIASLDPDELLEHVQGDRELLADIIRLFRAEAGPLLRIVREAAEDRDAAAISRASHTLKGSIGNFGSGPAYQAAKKMDELAQSGDASAAGALLPTLEAEIERLLVALEPFSGAEVK